MNVYSVDKIITEARHLTKEYREAAGKTLAITGEIAINDAIRLLDMSVASELNSGFDAEMEYQHRKLKVQIKGRAIINNKRSGHRLGQLKLEQTWDAIVLVIMDEDYVTREIYFADRETIVEAISESKNKRCSISVARFRIIGALLWTLENGLENDGYWSNAD